MGQEYIIDTNSVIDYLSNKIPEKGLLFIDSISTSISVMTRIELLGWYNATSEQIVRLKTYIDASIIHDLEENIILKTIELRQKYRIKTPDAIIAATSIHFNLVLISRNVSDFKNIEELSYIDPYNLII